jgi:hypothetical protein
VLIAMLLPDTGLAFLREEYGWLGSRVAWLEGFWPEVDMDHVVAFGVLGLAGRLAGMRLARWRTAAALAALAVLTEIAQFWIPGRTPLVSDALLDLAGALIGYAAAAAVLWRRR